MEISHAEILERMNLAFKIALYFHCVGLLIVAFLCLYQPAGYKAVGVIFSIAAFVTSLFISKYYQDAEKQLNKSKAFSAKGVFRIYSEQLLLFFFPYTFWCGCVGIFLLSKEGNEKGSEKSSFIAR